MPWQFFIIVTVFCSNYIDTNEAKLLVWHVLQQQQL
jgi:hypothetical protein